MSVDHISSWSGCGSWCWSLIFLDLSLKPISIWCCSRKIIFAFDSDGWPWSVIAHYRFDRVSLRSFNFFGWRWCLSPWLLSWYQLIFAGLLFSWRISTTTIVSLTINFCIFCGGIHVAFICHVVSNFFRAFSFIVWLSVLSLLHKWPFWRNFLYLTLWLNPLTFFLRLWLYLGLSCWFWLWDWLLSTFGFIFGRLRFSFIRTFNSTPFHILCSWTHVPFSSHFVGCTLWISGSLALKRISWGYLLLISHSVSIDSNTIIRMNLIFRYRLFCWNICPWSWNWLTLWFLVWFDGFSCIPRSLVA